MTYTITPAIRAAARRCGVEVRPSATKGKKLDAYIGERKIRSFGASGYGDYHIFQRTHGKEYADKKRQQYWTRHAKDAAVKYAPDGKLSAGWLAARILW